MNIQPDVKHDSVGNDDGAHGGEDFVLTGRSAWLRIDGYSLFISNKPQTLSVMLFPLNEEADDPVAGFRLGGRGDAREHCPPAVETMVRRV